MPPLRLHHLCHSPHSSLHPLRAPAFAPQSMHSHSPSIPSHTCSWAHIPSCHIQIHTLCPRACPFMCAPTNTQGPRYTPCTHTSPFPHAHAIQHLTCRHCKAGQQQSLLPSCQGSSSDKYPCSQNIYVNAAYNPSETIRLYMGSDTRKSGRYMCCYWHNNDNAADSNNTWVRGCTQPGSERAIHSDAVHDNNIQRGDSMQTTTRSKTWLLGACCLICGGGGSS